MPLGSSALEYYFLRNYGGDLGAAEGKHLGCDVVERATRLIEGSYDWSVITRGPQTEVLIHSVSILTPKYL